MYSLDLMFTIFMLYFLSRAKSDFSYREYFEIVNVQPVLEFLFATSVTIFMISVAGWEREKTFGEKNLKIIIT